MVIDRFLGPEKYANAPFLACLFEVMSDSHQISLEISWVYTNWLPPPLLCTYC